MEGGPFLTDEFLAFAKKYVLFLHVTSRVEGRKDDELFFDLDGSGFPTLMLLDADGAVLARRESDLTVEGFASVGTKTYRYLDLRKKAAAGDKAAGIDAALLACDLGQTDFYDLEEELEEAVLTDAQKQAFGVLKANTVAAEQEQVMRAARYDGLSIEQAAEEFLPLHKEGLAPDRAGARRTFWAVLAAHAAAADDAALAERANKELAGLGAERMVDQLRTRLTDHKKKN